MKKNTIKHSSKFLSLMLASLMLAGVFLGTGTLAYAQDDATEDSNGQAPGFAIAMDSSYVLTEGDSIDYEKMALKVFERAATVGREIINIYEYSEAKDVYIVGITPANGTKIDAGMLDDGKLAITFDLNIGATSVPLSFTITVEKAPELRLIAAPNISTYVVGESLDLSGAMLEYTEYANGVGISTEYAFSEGSFAAAYEGSSDPSINGILEGAAFVGSERSEAAIAAQEAADAAKDAARYFSEADYYHSHAYYGAKEAAENSQKNADFAADKAEEARVAKEKARDSSDAARRAATEATAYANEAANATDPDVINDATQRAKDAAKRAREAADAALSARNATRAAYIAIAGKSAKLIDSPNRVEDPDNSPQNGDAGGAITNFITAGNSNIVYASSPTMALTVSSELSYATGGITANGTVNGSATPSPKSYFDLISSFSPEGGSLKDLLEVHLAKIVLPRFPSVAGGISNTGAIPGNDITTAPSAGGAGGSGGIAVGGGSPTAVQLRGGDDNNAIIASPSQGTALYTAGTEYITFTHVQSGLSATCSVTVENPRLVIPNAINNQAIQTGPATQKRVLVPGYKPGASLFSDYNKELNRLGLKANITLIDDNVHAPDTLIYVSPGPGTAVQVGSTINVNVQGARVPEYIFTPSFQTLLSDYEAKLQTIGLNADVILVNRSSAIPPGVVVDTDPAWNTLVQVGSTVKVYVQVNMVPVPDFTDPSYLTSGDYINDLESLLFVVVTKEVNETSPADDGKVIRIEPDVVGGSLPEGSTITVCIQNSSLTVTSLNTMAMVTPTDSLGQGALNTGGEGTIPSEPGNVEAVPPPPEAVIPPPIEEVVVDPEPPEEAAIVPEET